MTIPEVLANLKSWDDWDVGSYPLGGKEAAVIIGALEGMKAITGTVKVALDDGAHMPERAHEDDAGYDLRARDAFEIAHGGAAIVDTGVHIAIPHGYYGKIEGKSGLNVKHGIVSLGGVIDSGYTGSIMVKLYNFGDDYHFNAGDKVAQLIIQPCAAPELAQVDVLPATERGSNGFGSTGD